MKRKQFINAGVVYIQCDYKYTVQCDILCAYSMYEDANLLLNIAHTDWTNLYHLYILEGEDLWKRT